jgi:hypothetical protein
MRRGEADADAKTDTQAVREATDQYASASRDASANSSPNARM